MPQTFFTVNATPGIDLNNAGSTQLFALGTQTLGNNNTMWVYVQANTSIVGNTMVAFNAAGTCAMASGADLLNGLQLATAQTSISSQAFGWVCVRGVGLTVKTTGSSSIQSAIYLAATGAPTGILSSVAAASSTLAGATFTDVANQTATATFTTVNLSWPRGFPAGQ